MGTQNVTVRAIEEADIDHVAKLLAELAAEFIFEEPEPGQERFLRKNDAAAIRGFIEAGFRYHVAERDGRLVGFVGMRENRHLYHLFVEKSAHGQGIATMLWDRARRECLAAGHRGPFTVNASNNAVAVYERWGFRREGPAQQGDGVRFNPMKFDSDG